MTDKSSKAAWSQVLPGLIIAGVVALVATQIRNSVLINGLRAEVANLKNQAEAQKNSVTMKQAELIRGEARKSVFDYVDVLTLMEQRYHSLFRAYGIEGRDTLMKETKRMGLGESLKNSMRTQERGY